MENYLKAVLLGIVQGGTEFLPISSSGHIVLINKLLNYQLGTEGLTLTVLLHFGTMMAVIVFFRKRIGRLILGVWGAPAFFRGEKGESADQFRTILLLIVSAVPAALLGITLEKQIEYFFADYVFLVPVMLIVTGIILLVTQMVKDRDGGQISWLHAAVMGVAQMISILPGISRSGATITAGLLCGAERTRAAEFSFLMSLPVIGGATLLKVFALVKQPPTLGSLGEYALGTFAAFSVGYICIAALMEVVKRQKLAWFSIYLFLIGAGGIVAFTVM